MGYLTPSTIPATLRSRRIVFPDSVDFLAIVTGALQELTASYNWQQLTGAVSIDDCVNAMLEMWFRFNDEGDLPVVGTIFAHCNTLTPDYALPCDGSQFDRVDYPELYASLDSVFIVDADHFVTPDLRGKTVLGTGLAASGTNYTINQSGGSETHTLTTSELASHSHSNFPHAHSESTAVPTAITIGAGAPAPSALPGVGVTGSASISIDNTGGDQPHNNMQPFRALKYAIWAR